MASEKKKTKPFSTCMEDVPFAQAMQELLGQQGMGSLCAEMMKRIREQQGAGRPGPCPCAETMESGAEKHQVTRQEQTEATKEEDDVDDE